MSNVKFYKNPDIKKLNLFFYFFSNFKKLICLLYVHV